MDELLVTIKRVENYTLWHSLDAKTEAFHALDRALKPVSAAIDAEREFKEQGIISIKESAEGVIFRDWPYLSVALDPYGCVQLLRLTRLDTPIDTGDRQLPAFAVEGVATDINSHSYNEFITEGDTHLGHLHDLDDLPGKVVASTNLAFISLLGTWEELEESGFNNPGIVAFRQTAEDQSVPLDIYECDELASVLKRYKSRALSLSSSIKYQAELEWASEEKPRRQRLGARLRRFFEI